MPAPATISKNISGFDPRSVPGCQLWLDAADSSSVTGTTTVTAWRDKSNNARNLSVGSGTTSYANNAITLASSYMLYTGAVDLTNFTFFIVAKSNGIINNQTVFGARPNTSAVYNSTDGFGFYMDYQSSIRLYGTTASGATVVSFSATTSVAIVYSFQSDSTIINGWRNGTSVTGASGLGARTSTAQGFALGGEWNGTTYVNIISTASINEIIVYNTNLSTNERQSIEGYLAWKWGLETVSTRSLVTGHPFYYYRPFSRAFQPIDIPGCMIWLDGADTTTMTPTNPSSGTTITAWRDKAYLMYSSGTTPYSFTPGAIQTAASNGTVYTVAGPTYVTGGGVLFNNSSGLLGNGQQGLGLYSSALNSSPLFTMPTQAMTIVVASLPATNAIYRRIAYLGSYQLGGAYLPNFLLGPQMGTYEGGTLAYDFNGSAWGQINYGSSGYNSNAVLRIDVMISAPGASQWWWTNGTLNTFNIASNVYTSTYSNYPVNFFFLASYTTTIDGNRNFYGTIYEVLLYNTAITTSQRQQIEGYLAWKWGFRTSLATTQPFYTYPPSSPTPFTPTAINYCELWLDGADPLGTGTQPTNGTGVSTWVDKSGSGNSAIAFTSINAIATPTNPTVVTNSLNGLPGLLFSGTSGMRCPAFVTSPSAAVFMVVNFSGSSGQPFIVWKVKYTNYLAIKPGIVYAGVNVTGSYAVDAQVTYTNTYGSPYLLGMTLTASSAASSAYTFVGSVNGTATTVTGTSTYGNTTGCSDFVGIGIDVESGIAYYPMYGTVYEVLVYNGGILPYQRVAIEGYLAWKWGLQNSLPSSHQYKLVPPTQSSQVSIIATGGTITTTPSVKYHTFTSSGSFVVTTGTTTVYYLVVGGGGGGGDRHGGGGGAGGVVSGSFTATVGTYTVTVGAGGYHGATTEGGQTQYGTPAGAGSKGGNSSISSVATAYGGGGGGTYDGNPSDTPLGSGGGGGGNSFAGIGGTAGQGYGGGSGQQPAGGGGGGAGGAGANANSGAGGIGTSAFSAQLLAVGYGTTFATGWIIGTATYQATPATYVQSPIVGGVAYIAAGGGGASYTSGPVQAGGYGGGGTGDWDDSYGLSGGTVNTGSGGGATRSNNTATVGRDGGSGLVLIWYAA